MKRKQNKEKPEVYAISRGKAGWKLSRRNFLAGVLGTRAAIGAVNKSGGKTFETGGEEETHLSAISCKQVLADRNRIQHIATSKTGGYLVTGSGDWGRTFKIWSLLTKTLMESHKEDKDVSSLAITPDGKWLLVAVSDYTGGRIRIYSLEFQKGVLNLKSYKTLNQNMSLYELVITPDGKYAVSAGSSGRLKFWSVPSGQLLKGWRDSEGTVNCLALSPQGKRLASGGRGYIKIWSLESATRGKLIRKIIEESGNAIMEIAYGAGGSLVACITNVLDWDVRIYKTDTGALFKSIQPFSLNTQAIAASPDGNYLAAGHEEVAVYNFSQGTLIKRFRVFGSSSSDSVDTLAFTGDNKYLIIGSYQGKLKIYNFRTGQIVRCFMDLASNSKDKLGVTYKYKDAQGNTVEVTVPSCQCSPLPQGATCICNTVKGSYCSCAGQCSCHGVHIYWYPN